MRGISRIAENRSASQGLCCMQSVNIKLIKTRQAFSSRYLRIGTHGDGGGGGARCGIISCVRRRGEEGAQPVYPLELTAGFFVRQAPSPPHPLTMSFISMAEHRDGSYSVSGSYVFLFKKKTRRSPSVRPSTPPACITAGVVFAL